LGYVTSTYRDDTSASPGTTYYYRVRAYNSAGYSNDSSSNSGWRGLSTPSGVSATDGTTNSTRVSWNNVTGASRYYVYRSTSSSGTYTLLGYVTGSYRDDTSATPGRTYYYQVRAYNSGNFSDYSSYNSGWIRLSQPSLISPAAHGTTADNTPSYDWSNVTGAVQYEIEIQGIETDYHYTFTTNVSNYTPSLLEDDEYYWRVRARDSSVRWSSWSSSRNFHVDAIRRFRITAESIDITDDGDDGILGNGEIYWYFQVDNNRGSRTSISYRTQSNNESISTGTEFDLSNESEYEVISMQRTSNNYFTLNFELCESDANAERRPGLLSSTAQFNYSIWETLDNYSYNIWGGSYSDGYASGRMNYSIEIID